MAQVYKENLVETILPSIQSVMTAVLHYKKMGGEANLYINDDGLQARTRLDTARPCRLAVLSCPLAIGSAPSCRGAFVRGAWNWQAKRVRVLCMP